MNHAAVNVHLPVFVWICTFIFGGRIPRREPAGSYVTLCFMFGGNAYPFLQQVCHFMPHQQCVRVAVSPHTCQVLLLSGLFFFLIIGILVCSDCVAMICISLMMLNIF